MNTAIFRRLFWKEYRQQRTFWLAMVFLTVFLIVLVEMSLQLFVTQTPREHSYHLIYVFLFSMLYALGCGATLFATEHDAGTYQFLRNLPLGDFSAFLPKIMLAVISTTGLACVLSFPIYLVAEYFYEHVTMVPWPMWFLGLGLALGWGTFFSMLVKRPLLATVLGAVVGIAVGVLVSIIVESLLSRNTLRSLENTPYYTVHLGIMVLLYLANVWLGRRWLGSWPSPTGRFAVAWGFGESSFAVASSENMEAPRAAVILRRLVWQQWRFSRLLMGVYVPGFVVLFGLFTASIFRTYHPGHLSGFFLPVWVGHILFLSCCLISLFGASVFHGDQRRSSVRFLAERAARPWHVWFSRQIVWCAPFLLVWLVLFCAWIFYSITFVVDIWSTILEKTTWYQTLWWCFVHFRREVVLRPAGVLGTIAVIFAAGQLCSMLFRSGLLAVVFGLTLSGMFAGWVALMMWLGAGLYWSVLPIAVGLFAATLLHTPDWMRGRTGWRQYVRPAVVALAPILAIVVVIPFYRVYSIPGGGPGFDVAEYSRPESEAEKATLEMYREACGQMQPAGLGVQHYYLPSDFWDRKSSEKQWLEEKTVEGKPLLEANKKAIALALAASRRESCGKFDMEFRRFPPTVILASMLVADANRLTQEGKLDLAAERFWGALRIASHLGRGMSFRGGEIIEGRTYDSLRYWAAAPGQTPKRIKATIGEIDMIAKSSPSGEDVIKANYAFTRSIISDKDKLLEFALSNFAGNWLSAWWYSLPWERARLIRMLDMTAAYDLESLINIDTNDPEYSRIRELRFAQYTDLPEQAIGYPIHKSRSFYHGTARIGGISDRIAFYELNMRTVLRATKIILALEAWKLERGKLPDTLDKLVGSYFKKLPTPPRRDEVFAYFPKGLPKRLWAFPSGAGNYGPGERAPFGTKVPLLLVCAKEYEKSGGRDVVNSGEIPYRTQQYPIDDLINGGFAFPIP